MSAVIYSASDMSGSGFSRYILFEWRPRRDLARRFVVDLRADPRFPRHLQSKDGLDFYLRHRRRRTLDWEKQVAASAWRAYLAAKRASAMAQAA